MNTVFQGITPNVQGKKHNKCTKTGGKESTLLWNELMRDTFADLVQNCQER